MPLVNGEWRDKPPAADEIKGGAFHRLESPFRDWITPDGSPGPDGKSASAAEPGRYELYIAYSCPWASRTLAVRALKGLEDAIAVHAAEPFMGSEGWHYAQEQNGGATGPFHNHHRLYTATDAAFTGKATVPVLWDRAEGRIVNNESADIVRILNDGFIGIAGNDLDLYPEALRPEIDRWNDRIYPALNNGVYRAGFATAQHAYDEAVRDVFEALDEIDAHLAAHRYLAGEWLTEADIRLFVTLIRFDIAYYGAFKCNLRYIDEYAALPGYLREIYQWPGIAGTVNLDHIKRGYYGIRTVNPTQIVPIGPEIDIDGPPGRDALSGKGVATRTLT
ncbi:glutathione S-transferase family protein [Parasphingopyxis marina]|uniref:glutathione S-transferase family protein n=1 Tax=Parasphingopyxis marina TaxID=2761622 RepID=UPI002E2CE317|nr:glutathione S-transferase family protein [Parasphingopyxis marina]